jgi:hypothetical protein
MAIEIIIKKSIIKNLVYNLILKNYFSVIRSSYMKLIDLSGPIHTGMWLYGLLNVPNTTGLPVRTIAEE